ncbi:hypothetical protein HYD80_03920 [Mycoplasmopsis bovis]|nr:hypothetical protein [Mycoplasmopsis bovis]QQH42709.1 hypothetical protein HYD80_03920 [Mycoplasmopsis bovis]
MVKPKKRRSQKLTNLKLSETLKSITGNDLGKVQVAEQDKSNKENWNSYQRSYCYKSSNTKRQELNLNADLSKKA